MQISTTPLHPFCTSGISTSINTVKKTSNIQVVEIQITLQNYKLLWVQINEDSDEFWITKDTLYIDYSTTRTYTYMCIMCLVLSLPFFQVLLLLHLLLLFPAPRRWSLGQLLSRRPYHHPSLPGLVRLDLTPHRSSSAQVVRIIVHARTLHC